MNTSEKGGRRNGKRGRKNKWKIGLRKRKDSRVPGRLLPAGMSSLGPPRGRGGTPGWGGGEGWMERRQPRSSGLGHVPRSGRSCEGKRVEWVSDHLPDSTFIKCFANSNLHL